jgi:hypothetical protein
MMAGIRELKTTLTAHGRVFAKLVPRLRGTRWDELIAAGLSIHLS